MHVAPFWHGLLKHSSMSSAQFVPLKPRAQVHSYSPGAIPEYSSQLLSVTFSLTTDMDSLHVAPFWHGLLAHSSTSTLQFPPKLAFAELSNTLHSALYSEMKSYSHHPFAKPATHVHWYA